MNQNTYDLNIGAHVHCKDGRCGKLAKYAVDTESWQVTHLIVEEGFLLKRSRVFPLTTIGSVTSDEIQLRINSEEIQQYPEYREEIVETPAPQQEPASVAWREGPSYGHSVAPPIPIVREKVRYGVPEEHAVIERGTPINGLDGRIGALDHLVVESNSGEIAHVIVQQGILFTTQSVIPVSMLESISESGMLVAGSKEELEDLPRYEVVASYTTDDSVTRITGDTREMDLATRVATALFSDPRTSEAVIEVVDEQGMITLSGSVEDLETRQAAEQIAREQRGVVSVTNLLVVNS